MARGFPAFKSMSLAITVSLWMLQVTTLRLGHKTPCANQAAAVFNNQSEALRVALAYKKVEHNYHGMCGAVVGFLANDQHLEAWTAFQIAHAAIAFRIESATVVPDQDAMRLMVRGARVVGDFCRATISKLKDKGKAYRELRAVHREADPAAGILALLRRWWYSEVVPSKSDMVELILSRLSWILSHQNATEIKDKLRSPTGFAVDMDNRGTAEGKRAAEAALDEDMELSNRETKKRRTTSDGAIEESESLVDAGAGAGAGAGAAEKPAPESELEELVGTLPGLVDNMTALLGDGGAASCAPDAATLLDDSWIEELCLNLAGPGLPAGCGADSARDGELEELAGTLPGFVDNMTALLGDGGAGNCAPDAATLLDDTWIADWYRVLGSPGLPAGCGADGARDGELEACAGTCRLR